MKNIGLLILAFLAINSCNFKEDGIIKYNDLVNIYECDDKIYLCMRKNETYSIESFDKSVTIASELNFVPDLIFFNGNQFLFTKHYDSINSLIKIYDSAGNVKEKIYASCFCTASCLFTGELSKHQKQG